MLATKLDEFTLAYIECALWSEMDDAGDPLDENYGINDIDPETLDQMVADCYLFQSENATDLVYNSQEWTDAELGGHDFWLTRNWHGAGFWDRDYLPERAGARTGRCPSNGRCPQGRAV